MIISIIGGSLCLESMYILGEGNAEEIKLVLDKNATELLNEGEFKCADMLYDYLKRYCETVLLDAVHGNDDTRPQSITIAAILHKEYIIKSKRTGYG